MSAPSILERARAAWGGTPPAWVEALARECERAKQVHVAKWIGVSPTAVSLVLSNKYGAGLNAIQTAVEGVLMAATVNCPVLGSLGSDVCQQHQKSAFSSVNPLRIQLYRACRSGCAHSRLSRTEESKPC